MWYAIISLPNYYWSRDAKNSNAEIDYLMIFDGMIYPVEVKDVPSVKLRSLHLYRETYQPSWSVVEIEKYK